jgi:hypothetical protein
VMGGGGRSSTGDEEGGAGDASSGPEFEVGAPHRTGTDPAPPLVHLRRGLCVGVIIPHSLPRAWHCPWDPDKMRSAGTAVSDSASESSSLTRFLGRGTAPGTPTRCNP